MSSQGGRAQESTLSQNLALLAYGNGRVLRHI